MKKLKVRRYTTKDYESVKEIYVQTNWFDEVTDSELGLSEKIRRDKDSILVAVNENNEIIGTVSIIEDGRIAWFFRLLARKDIDNKIVRNKLIEEAEKLLKGKGYKNVHIFSLDSDSKLHEEYENQGFMKGRLFQWFWKKL